MQQNQWAMSVCCNGLWFGSMGFFVLLIIAAVHHAKAVLEAKREIILSLQRRRQAISSAHDALSHAFALSLSCDRDQEWRKGQAQLISPFFIRRITWKEVSCTQVPLINP